MNSLPPELPTDAAAYLVESALAVCRSRGLDQGATREEIAAVLRAEARAVAEGATRRQIGLIEQIIAPRPSEGVERLMAVLDTRIYHQALRRASIAEEQEQYENALEKVERVSFEW